MTTIAYKDGIVAADSLVVIHGTRDPAPAAKLFRLGKGVAAITGDLAVAIHGVEKLTANPKLKALDLGEGTRVLLFRPRFIRVFELNASYDRPSTVGAWGSGMDFALGAMSAGASAAEAVAIAAEHDIYTGGKIDTLRLLSHNLEEVRA